MNGIEPAHTVRRSVDGARKTLTVDIAQMEHRDTVKHAFSVKMLDELLLELVDDVLYGQGYTIAGAGPGDANGEGRGPHGASQPPPPEGMKMPRRAEL